MNTDEAVPDQLSRNICRPTVGAGSCREPAAVLSTELELEILMGRWKPSFECGQRERIAS